MIQGKQVYLRGLEREDLKILHRMENDEEMMEWGRFRPDYTVSKEALDKEYEEELKGEAVKKRTFTIVHKKSGRVIGWSSIRWWRPFHTSADIGLVIDKGFRGKGIGTEVTGILTELAFDQYNMHKVELFTRTDNKAMIRSAERNGFRAEGKIRETLYFNGKFHDGLQMGVLRAEFERARSGPGRVS